MPTGSPTRSGDLPLALAQAAGLLAETGMPVAEYLGLLDEAPAEVLDEGAPISYPRSLAKSLRVAVAQLAGADPAAAQLLSLCAFLAPEPIPTGWFPAAEPGVLPQPLAATAAAPLAYRRTLGMLGRYGLVKLGDDHLTVHRLTQRLLRADDPDPRPHRDSHRPGARRPDPRRPDDPTTWPAWADLLPHLRALDLAGTDDEQLAWQACRSSRYLLRRGEPRASHDMIAPLYQAWRDRLGPSAWPTLWAATYLARALAALGRSNERRHAGRATTTTTTAPPRRRPPRHPRLGQQPRRRPAALGEHEQARALDEDTLTRRRRVLGDDHPDTLASASNLAADLRALGEHEQARALDEDTLARRRRVLGDDHPDTLTSASNLAHDLRALGEHEQARALDEDTLTRRRRVLGDDHPDTLTSANNLAADLRALGEHEQARALDEDTLARRRRVLGDDHPDTALSVALLQWLDLASGGGSR